MFKLLVLSCLVAVAMAAPADVVATKQAESQVTVNKNDPYNPNDDTVTKKQSVSETVSKTDGAYPALPAGLDKNTLASLSSIYNLYGVNPFFNPYGYSPLFNPLANPYLYNPYGAVYNPYSSLYPPKSYSAYPPAPAYPSPYKAY